MENKHKLLATASSQDQGVCHDTIIDRFSTLPDEIAHHVLSMVDLRDLTRVGAVSKRCYDFYLSTPSFRFDSDYDNMQRKSNKMNCFDQFLRRRGNNKIHHFGIDLSFPASLSCKVFQVMTWIDNAARCSVEVLNLQLTMRSKGNMVGLPSSIFRCGSLRSLLVKMEEIFKVPSFPCPNNLQRLNLSYVRIDEEFSKWISSSCKCIKEIKLSMVSTNNLTIENSSLESFTFVACSNLCCLNISGEKLEIIHIKWQFFNPGSRALHICAPNLKYLKWVGDLVSHPKLGKLLCLEKAEIFLEAKSICVCDFHNAFELLCSICRVKALILSDKTIKALFREGSMAAPIFDTSYLRINSANLNNALVPAMVSLMRGMSNLNTLDIKSDPSLFFLEPKACGFNGKYWKSQNLDFVNQLKEVTIELSNGNNAWQLARFILEHAQNLKKMTIFYLPRKLHVIDKVSNSKKVSSATIDFHEKQWR
ncbi:F-box/LRR-repeat protein [Rosa sericea]